MSGQSDQVVIKTENEDKKATESPSNNTTTTSDPIEESTLAEPKFFNVTVKSPTGIETELQISLADNVQDIKQLLIEAKDLCHITCYNLIFNGEKINNFAELKDLEGLEEGSVITMEEQPYSEFTSRIHVHKLRELLSDNLDKPISLLNSLTNQIEEEMASKSEELQKKTQNQPKTQNQSNNKKGGRKGKKNRKNKKQQQQTTSVPQSKSQAAKQSEFPVPVDSKLDQIHFGSFYPKQKTKIKCVASISYSGWNPPPGNRQCKGDLSYLVVQTLENATFHITSSCRGFYVNNSNSSKFNPLPAEKSYFSHSLVDLLRQISPLFKRNFQKLIDNYFVYHPFAVIPVPQEDVNLPWLDSANDHTNDLNRTELFLSGDEIFQFPDQLRDWNAEYQSCKELPKSTLQERILRDRSIIKVTNEFVIGAVAGAKAIINGAVIPLNPTDPKSAHLFIYNNIFFSLALNGRFLFDEEEGDMGPYKFVNNDLNGVNAYNIIDLPELHTVLTVLVNYRGYRIVAQSIIPGILHQASSDCIRYGTVDHGKTLVWSEEFHDVMKKAAELLRIPEHEVQDESGKCVKLYCSTETKGVLGTDGKKYVLDLDHTTVRDPNFEESWALLRLELYDIFDQWKQHRHTLKHKAKLAEAAKRRADEAKLEQKEEPEQKAESSEEAEAKTKENTTTNDDKNQENETDIPEFVHPVFNPNGYALKHCKLVGDEESIKEAENQVKELGSFLMDYVIPMLANEIMTNMTYPSDSVTLTHLLHTHGVNMRYLGVLAKLLQSEKPYVKDLMIREMIVRSTKHILNQFMRDAPIEEGKFADSVSHFLNCFIRGAFMRNYNNPSGPVESHVPELFSLTPTSLWKLIEEKVNTQFHYELKKEEFQAAEYVLPAIRTLCQKTGVSIRARQYDIYAHQPVTSDDIMGVFPVVKMPTSINTDAQELIDGGKKFLVKGRVDIAFELLTEALQIFHQTHGPMHPNTAQCYSHLAMVLNHIGDFTQALIHQSKAIIILERTKGLDYYETAFEYGNLGLFYHQAKHAPLAFGFLKRSLYLTTLIGGPNHPDNASALTNMAAILQDNKDFIKAIHFYKRALECFEFHYGPKHVNIASNHHNIALCNAHLNNFRAALTHEKKSYEFFNEFFGENDPRTKESNSFLQQFTTKAVQIEKDLSKTQPKITTGPSTQENRPTDDSIGTLPIRDIMKYINNSEQSKVRPSFRK